MELADLHDEADTHGAARLCRLVLVDGADDVVIHVSVLRPWDPRPTVVVRAVGPQRDTERRFRVSLWDKEVSDGA